MLYASSRVAFGDRSLRTHLALGHSARIFAADRVRLRSDSLYFPTAPEKQRAVSQLWFLLEGTGHASFYGERVELKGPSLVLLPEDMGTDPADKRRVRLLIEGERVRSVQVHYRGPLVELGVQPLGGDLLSAASTYHDAVLGGPEVEDASGLANTFFDALHHAKVVPAQIPLKMAPSAVQGHHIRVWKAMREMYAGFDTSSSVKLIAATCGLSRRHTARLIAEIFRDYLLPPGGFKEVMLTLRLSLASMLLASGDVSVAEVAERVGYGYPESLTNAFRRANLPPPTFIRDEVTA